MKFVRYLGLLAGIGLALTASAASSGRWGAMSRQAPAWYATDEAKRIADNLLLFQTQSGGWPKNVDMTLPPDQVTRDGDPGEVLATIDNDASTTQINYLARVITAHDDPRLRASCLRGIDYLLAAQYANGGWPQYYPIRPGYYTHITFNDNAMINAMTVLRDAAIGEAPYAFVDYARRLLALAAVEKGVQCILKCQVKVNGKLTVWCAQHNEVTLAPAPGRSYELASLSGQESVNIVEFLMAIPHPSPEIVASIRGAVEWFKSAELHGIRSQRGVVVADPNAPPLWGRFYDIDTNKPIFSGRDGIKKDNLADIEAERRNGYAWYGNWPQRLLDTEYSAWEKQIAPVAAAANP